MKGKTHLLFGLGTGCLLASVTTPDNLIQGSALIACTALGSLFPDIDNPMSTISKKFKITSTILNKMFGHRTFFHSPFCCALLTGILYFIFKANELMNWWGIILGFAVGFIGHLFLDSLTKGGIPFLYPFKTKRYHFTNIKTGGFGEKIVFAGACVVTILAFGVFVYLTNIKEFEVATLLNIFKLN